jgi:signal transduction histidine kinase
MNNDFSMPETGTLPFLERERRVAASLRETLAVLNSNHLLDDILRFIVHQAREILSAQAVAIYCPTGQNWLMQIQAQEGLSEAYACEARIPLGMLATGSAALRRQPVAIPDVTKAIQQHDMPLDRESKAILEILSQNYQAVLVVPMIFPKGEVYGTLDLYFDSPRMFDEGDVALARAYSDQAMLDIENARLSRRVEQAAILSERDRLARELHDTVTQTLCTVSLISDVLPTLWEQDAKHGRLALEELRQLSRGALAEMRMLLFELRPVALLEADFYTLLQQLTNAFNSRTRIPVRFEGAKFTCRLPADVKIALYRITQELLNNIEKHARADQVEVVYEKVQSPAAWKRSNMHCRECQQCVRILVADNGQGFELDSATSDHMGLRIIRERAEGIRASLKIESAPGQGTRVEVIW